MENNIALIGTGEGSISKNDVRHTGFIVRFLARLLDIIVLVAIINILFYLDTLGGGREAGGPRCLFPVVKPSRAHRSWIW